MTLAIRRDGKLVASVRILVVRPHKAAGVISEAKLTPQVGDKVVIPER